jgi:hypothetical protein
MKQAIEQFIQTNIAPGEMYAGIVFDTEGKPDHHLILLPTEAEAINWEEAKAFAEKAGGELPTRQQQALLYANLKGKFQNDWYWSGEQHAVDSAYAWFQNFFNGYQDTLSKSAELRARAVRRVSI